MEETGIDNSCARQANWKPLDVPDPTLLQPQVGVDITAEDLMDGDGDSGANARGTPAITTGDPHVPVVPDDEQVGGRGPPFPAPRERIPPTPQCI